MLVHTLILCFTPYIETTNSHKTVLEEMMGGTGRGFTSTL